LSTATRRSAPPSPWPGSNWIFVCFRKVVFTLGAIPTIPYATPTTDEPPRVIKEYIGRCDAMILDRHGTLTVGESLTGGLLQAGKDRTYREGYPDCPDAGGCQGAGQEPGGSPDAGPRGGGPAGTYYPLYLRPPCLCRQSVGDQ